MKLSEAIRLGSMLRPQARDAFFQDGRSCALGAAAEASGIAYYTGSHTDEVKEKFKALIHEWGVDGVGECPVCGRSATYQVETIGHLNDYHGWTREQIADWVETIESASPQAEALEVTR